MEPFIVIGLLLALFLFVAPIILSILALNRSHRAESDLQDLRARLQALEMRDAKSPQAAPLSERGYTPAAAPAPVEAVATSLVEAPPKLSPPPLPPKPAAPPPPVEAKPAHGNLEVTLGGKVASFVGIAVFVLGIVFFVGYAITQNLLGPTMRVVLGLLAGGALVVGGHLAEVRSDRLHILARALTGGGAALFYFTVFAAHGIYHLIGPTLAGLGLAASAAVVFALAALYRSQAVAILGLLGAFLTPPLIHGVLDQGLFPMLYVAVINVPVLLLGYRRNWQILYNLALVLTAVLAAVWLEHELPGRMAAAFAFVAVFFLQFAGLSALKAGQARSDAAHGFDLVRQALAGLLLLGALFWITEEAHHEKWRGALFLAVAVANIGLTRLVLSRAGGLRDEALGFLIIALTFASLALPAQLDGPWVSLGWGIEGALLCWFGLRAGSPLLQGGAFLLALLGLAKSMGFDLTLFDVKPGPFLNSRFAVGLLSSALLLLQGWMHGRAEKKAPTEEAGVPAGDLVFCAGLLALVAVGVADVLFTARFADLGAWFFTTLVLAAVAVGATLAFPPGRLPFSLGVLLLILLPVKLVLDLVLGWDFYGAGYPAFANRWLWMRLVLLGAGFWWFAQVATKPQVAPPTAAAFFLTSIGSAMVLVSREIHRFHSAWADSGITIFWAVCALALVGAGLLRHRRYLRLAGLALFGIALVKVFFVDLSDLHGLQRVAAFMGAGVLLLILSYAYQRVAPLLLAAGREEGS